MESAFVEQICVSDAQEVAVELTRTGAPFTPTFSGLSTQLRFTTRIEAFLTQPAFDGETLDLSVLSLGSDGGDARAEQSVVDVSSGTDVPWYQVFYSPQVQLRFDPAQLP